MVQIMFIDNFISSPVPRSCAKFWTYIVRNVISYFEIQRQAGQAWFVCTDESDWKAQKYLGRRNTSKVIRLGTSSTWSSIIPPEDQAFLMCVDRSYLSLSGPVGWMRTPSTCFMDVSTFTCIYSFIFLFKYLVFLIIRFFFSSNLLFFSGLLIETFPVLKVRRASSNKLQVRDLISFWIIIMLFWISDWIVLLCCAIPVGIQFVVGRNLTETFIESIGSHSYTQLRIHPVFDHGIKQASCLSWDFYLFITYYYLQSEPPWVLILIRCYLFTSAYFY